MISPDEYIVPDLRDTDAEEVRVYRAHKQLEFYGLSEEKGSSIEALYKLAIKDRYLVTRETLFPREEFEELYANIGTVEVVTRDVAPVDSFFPPVEITRETLVPRFFSIIDQSYEAILDIKQPSIREAAFKRLASVAYSLGIMLHPAKDGNGQMFKTIALSYLHEGCAQYTDRYFPLKISHDLADRDSTINSTFANQFCEIPLPNIVPKSERDRELIELVKQIQAIAEQTDEDEVDDESYELNYHNRNRDIYLLMKDHADKLGIDVSELEENLETYFPKNYVKGSEIIAPSNAAHNSLVAIGRVLVEKGYDEDIVTSLIFRISSRRAKSTEALRTLLENEDCADCILRYIVEGENSEDRGIKDGRSLKVVRVAIKSFQEIEFEMSNILGNPSVSSSESILAQMELGDRYIKVVQQFERLGRTDLRRYASIRGILQQAKKAGVRQEGLIHILEEQIEQSADDTGYLSRDRVGRIG